MRNVEMKKRKEKLENYTSHSALDAGCGDASKMIRKILKGRSIFKIIGKKGK
jgi:hypothetical protein